MPGDAAGYLDDAQRDEIDDDNEAVRLHRSNEMDGFIGAGLFELRRDGFLAVLFRHLGFPWWSRKDCTRRPCGARCDTTLNADFDGVHAHPDHYGDPIGGTGTARRMDEPARRGARATAARPRWLRCRRKDPACGGSLGASCPSQASSRGLPAIHSGAHCSAGMTLRHSDSCGDPDNEPVVIARKNRA